MSDMEISKMNFKQLRNEVQELRDELARFKRAYNDTIENLDDSNLSEYLIKEKEGMKTEIEVSADGIKALVVKSDELGERCTTIEATADKIQTQVTKNQENIGKFDSKLTQTAEEITAEVTAVKEDVGTFKTEINQRADSIESSVSAIETDVGEFNSKIEQTKDSITTAVNAAYSNPVEVNNFNNVSPKIESVIYYDTTTNLYWHYDGEKWVSGSNANFGTVFEQTADGFNLKGNVKVSGDLITSGTISAERIDTKNLSCTRLYSPISDAYYAKVYSQTGDFGLYSKSAADSAGVSDTNCVWGIYNNVDAVNFYTYGKNYLGYNRNSKKVFPKGEWDFGSCTVSNLNGGGSGGIAVFG